MHDKGLIYLFKMGNYTYWFQELYFMHINKKLPVYLFALRIWYAARKNDGMVDVIGIILALSHVVKLEKQQRI